MSEPSPTQPGPPPKFWDALPQIIGKLGNEYLLVTLGILILVVAIGVFAPGVVDELGAPFFYLLVVLAWLAYIIGRTLDAWLKLRESAPLAIPADASQPPPLPAQPQPQTAPVNTQPSTIAPSAAASTAGQAELDQLYEVLVARFDREELRTLCFKLGVDYDDLRGEGREGNARELVKYMSRRDGGLEQLRAAIRAERPGAA